MFAFYCIILQEAHHGAGRNSATHSSPLRNLGPLAEMTKRQKTNRREQPPQKETKITERVNLTANNIFPVHSLFI